MNNDISKCPKIISPAAIPCHDMESIISQWIPNQVRYDNMKLILAYYLLRQKAIRKAI
jgi:hypothetical protein